MQYSSVRKVIFITLIPLAITALALMAMPASHVLAQTAGDGRIEGVIVNGTKGSAPASTVNLSVTLMSAVQGATSIMTQTTSSDAAGKFAFSSLDTISTTRYLVAARYADVEYYSDVLAFASAVSNTLPAAVTVYETTEDPSIVQVTEMHVVMDVQPPWLAVQQIVVVQNSGDRVFIGKPAGPHRTSLILPILSKAINIQFDDQTVDQTTMRGEDIMTYTLPIAPGQDQIFFQYDIPYTAPKYDFSLTMPYDVARFGLYAVDVGETLTSTQLSPAPSPMGAVPNAPKLIATGGDKFTAGTTIKATLDKLPAKIAQPGQTPSAPQNIPQANALPVAPKSLAAVVLGAAILAAVALIVLPMVRRRMGGGEEEEDEEEDEDAEADPRKALMQEIADLDDAFEQGDISEAEYKEQRATLKAKLAEMDE